MEFREAFEGELTNLGVREVLKHFFKRVLISKQI